jgi:hypothetical protein
MKRQWLGDPAQPKAPELPQAKAPELPRANLPEPTSVQEPPPEWAGKKARVDAIHAPFELEPDEIPPIGQRPDYDKILSDRQLKKLRKAENRREAERRKAKKLLA